MAPSRGKGKASSASSRGRRSTTRSKPLGGTQTPDIYASMLADAEHDELAQSERPVKRRKIAGNSKVPVVDPPVMSVRRSKQTTVDPDNHSTRASTSPPALARLQTVEDSSEEDASEFDFEDVDLDGATTSADEHLDEIDDLSISVQTESSTTQRGAQNRRKPATSAEKSHRLLVHKLHVLCLLGHCMYVNGRCNNPGVHRHLRPLLSIRTISYLNPKTTDTQFQRNRSFLDGLQQAVDAFNGEYRITGSGMIKPVWTVGGESAREYDQLPPMDRSDFIAAARDLAGSQDTGNQLFCALLRAAGVDARVICSLQVLPFTSVPKGSTPQKPIKERILAIAPDTDLSRGETSAEETAIRGNSRMAIRKRLGQPAFARPKKPATPPKKKAKPLPKLSYPVFWVEAFNDAHQKWVPVDPVVTHAVNKSVKLEPPASYDLNQMTYVIACESDGTARDVTKRYAKAYNAKTRRHRVEASPDGAKWFKKALRIFRRRGGLSDRDQVEDAELAQKEAREGMPGNVLDFKDHPYYALERHLKRHEVLHPRREVGKVNAGTVAKPRMEPVFRRQDVQICKSADKWYRVGREIIEGEQPLKHVPARRKRLQTPENGQPEAETTALYAPYQTQLYIPPPVERGRIPRNVYGNLDIYVPSMVPAGAAHLRAARSVTQDPSEQARKQFNELAQRAAKLLRVDFADAVTGFKFQGRTGTAIVDGIVVAQQYAEAVIATIDGLEYEVEEEESRARSLLALKLWKRFLTGLRIAERVSQYGTGGKGQAQLNEEVDAAKVAVEGPGMFLEGTDEDKPLITAGQHTIGELMRPGRASKQKKRKKMVDSEDETMYHDEPLHDDDDEGLGFLPAGHVTGEENMERWIVHEVNSSGGGFLSGDAEGSDHGNDNEGGFLVEADHERGSIAEDDLSGGGFLLEDEPTNQGGYLVSQHDEGGGFVPDNDVDRDGQQHNGQATHQASRPLSPTARSIQPSSETHLLRTNVGHATFEPQPEIKRGATAPDVVDDSDKGSLLSHDPEDEDAEPDWLESD